MEYRLLKVKKFLISKPFHAPTHEDYPEMKFIFRFLLCLKNHAPIWFQFSLRDHQLTGNLIRVFD